MAVNQSPNANTYDPPYLRPPNVADFNGAGKVDDSLEPPDPTTMPNAEEWNTIEFLLVALGNIVPFLEVSVTAGATPAITAVLSPTSAVNGNAGAIYLTRSSAGVYIVETGNGSTSVPSFTGQPKAFLNTVLTTADVCVAATYVTGPNGHPAAKVTTVVSGTLTDVNFTVQMR